MPAGCGTPALVRITPRDDLLADETTAWPNRISLVFRFSAPPLALFSGSTQGVTDNGCPLAFRNQANRASQLVAAKLTFTGFSEDLPSAGYTGCKADRYRRKHNP